MSTFFILRRPIRWWTTDCWRGPSIAPVTSTLGTGTWMWSANVSTISATLPSREYQTRPSQPRPISNSPISTSSNLKQPFQPYLISTSPNLKFSLRNLKLTHFNLTQSLPHPISNFPCLHDLKLSHFNLTKS